MSIVSMQRMSLVAHQSERTKLLRIFIKLGCVEMIASKDNVSVTSADVVRRDKMESVKFRAAFAINFLKEYSKEIIRYDKKLAPKVNLKKENRLVSLEEYEEVCNNTEELFAKIDEMESINNRVVDLKSERTRLQSQAEQLLPYKDLDLDMSKVADGDYYSVFCGLLPMARTEEFKKALADLY
ncbi:MAG: hypothetical protein IJ676_02480, partial [Clostridia bacterium]|nr:hypothetical protein [Clostridia bacterium]